MFINTKKYFNLKKIINLKSKTIIFEKDLSELMSNTTIFVFKFPHYFFCMIVCLNCCFYFLLFLLISL